MASGVKGIPEGGGEGERKDKGKDVVSEQGNRRLAWGQE